MPTSIQRSLVISIMGLSVFTADLARADQDWQEGDPVPFGDWLDAAREVIDGSASAALDHEYRSFASRHRLPVQDEGLKRDFVRVRLLFEAVRDGGFWHLHWAVTDRYPSSKDIWRTWSRQPVRRGFAEPSATAECDELSALLGMLARHMKLHDVGLFYPTWNHTIAVWAPLAGQRKTTLVQLPTTQIFLDCAAGYDHTSFRTFATNVERYPNLDLRRDYRLPGARAGWLLNQLRTYAPASPSLWSLVRAKRSLSMRSTMGECSDARRQWREDVQRNLTPADETALLTLARDELLLPRADATEVMRWLAE